MHMQLPRQYQFISTKPVDWKGNLLIRCEGDSSSKFSITEEGVVWDGAVEKQANFIVYFDASPDSTKAIEPVEKA